MNFKLVCCERKLEKCVAKSNFLYTTISSEQLAGCHLAKENIIIEKPIYVDSARVKWGKCNSKNG
jgi:hypothetical protein